MDVSDRNGPNGYLCKLCGRWVSQGGDLCIFHIQWHLALYGPTGRMTASKMEEADAMEELNIAQLKRRPA